MLNGEVGYGDSYGDTKALPFYKNFYAGGVNTVRGYKAGSLGPQDIYGNTIGGNERFIGQTELLWALPGMEKSVRLGVFFDIGQVWASGGTSAGVPGVDDSLRYSAGLSAAWISPVGPLKVSYGYPINKQDTDKTEAFQFQLGTTF